MLCKNMKRDIWVLLVHLHYHPLQVAISLWCPISSLDVSHTLLYPMLFARRSRKKTASVHQKKKGVQYTLVKSPFTANPNLKPQNGALWCSRSAKTKDMKPILACYYPSPTQKGSEEIAWRRGELKQLLHKVDIILYLFYFHFWSRIELWSK